jgi:hypothetical protein
MAWQRRSSLRFLEGAPGRLSWAFAAWSDLGACCDPFTGESANI